MSDQEAHRMARIVIFARLVGCCGLFALVVTSACSTPRPYTGWDASQSGGIGGALGAGGGKESGSEGTGTGGSGPDASVATGGLQPRQGRAVHLVECAEEMRAALEI